MTLKKIETIMTTTETDNVLLLLDDQAIIDSWFGSLCEKAATVIRALKEKSQRDEKRIMELESAITRVREAVDVPRD